jgi:hypothetical protein
VDDLLVVVLLTYFIVKDYYDFSVYKDSGIILEWGFWIGYIMDLMLFEEFGELVGKIVLVDSLAMGVGWVHVKISKGWGFGLLE